MSALHFATGTAADSALSAALGTLERAVGSSGGTITPAAETQLQNAIDLLRRSEASHALLPQLEQMAIDLRAAVNARLSGRPNLHASRLARLRRALGARAGPKQQSRRN